MRENNRDDVRNTLFQIIESVLKIDAACIKEDMELAADLVRRIDVERRPRLRGQTAERHALDEEVAAFIAERVVRRTRHGFIPGKLLRISFK